MNPFLIHQHPHNFFSATNHESGRIRKAWRASRRGYGCNREGQGRGRYGGGRQTKQEDRQGTDKIYHFNYVVTSS